MRAISLHQPHASLMTLLRPEPNPRRLAEKVFETRGPWAHKVSLGPLVIHAAKSHESLDDILDETIRATFSRHLGGRGLVFRDVLPFGAAVAVVDVVAVWETGRPRMRLVRAADGAAAPSLLAGVHESAFRLGDFSPGRILLQCENVRPLAEPVPMRGYQQVWKLTPEQVGAVNAQVLERAEAAA